MPSCFCSSGRDYETCCGPYIDAKAKAPSAEALMRARYSAYASQRIEFITRTHDPKTRSRHDPESARQWSEGAEWRGLEIKSLEGGGPADGTGTVEFIARYASDGGEEVEHHEVASFRRDGDEWYFVDGKLIGAEPIRRESPKVGRNDPCPCGSGKKYKKCCGAA